VCAEGRAQLAAPLRSQFLLDSLFCDTLEHRAGWDFTELWRFCFPELHQIGWHRRWSDDSQKAGRDTRGKEVANQEDTGFSPNSTSKPDKTPHVVLTHRTSPSILQTTMDCVPFLALSA
jgi:hypothetical protein